MKVNDKITNTFKSLVGVRQGGVVSPNLFKIFINDLPNYLSFSQGPMFLNNKRLECLIYADDVILLSSLQEVYNKNSICCKLFARIGVFLLILIKQKFWFLIKRADLLTQIDS